MTKEVSNFKNKFNLLIIVCYFNGQSQQTDYDISQYYTLTLEMPEIVPTSVKQRTAWIMEINITNWFKLTNTLYTMGILTNNQLNHSKNWFIRN